MIIYPSIWISFLAIHLRLQQNVGISHEYNEKNVKSWVSRLKWIRSNWRGKARKAWRRSIELFGRSDITDQRFSWNSLLPNTQYYVSQKKCKKWLSSCRLNLLLTILMITTIRVGRWCIGTQIIQGEVVMPYNCLYANQETLAIWGACDKWLSFPTKL